VPFSALKKRGGTYARFGKGGTSSAGDMARKKGLRHPFPPEKGELIAYEGKGEYPPYTFRKRGDILGNREKSLHLNSGGRKKKKKQGYAIVGPNLEGKGRGSSVKQPKEKHPEEGLLKSTRRKEKSRRMQKRSSGKKKKA